MRKQQSKTYQDLLVAINLSKSEKGFRRLLAAEQRAAGALAETRNLQGLQASLGCPEGNAKGRRKLSAAQRKRLAEAERSQRLAQQSFEDSVCRLVRWIDEPFPASLAETLIREHIRQCEAENL